MNRYLFFALVAAGVAFRLAMLGLYGIVNGGDVDVYLADEGVVGLMGKHILEGRSFPVFFYGQYYLGALEAYCAALSFAVFGMSLSSLRLVPLAFSLALLPIIYTFVYRWYSVAAARWATALVAVAPLYFLQWNLKARGGFIEHVVLMFLVFVLFWRFYLEYDRRPRVAFGLGLVSGVALWVNQLALAYFLVMAALLAFNWRDRRGWALLLVGASLGASLLLVDNVRYPAATVRALARKAVVLNRVPIEERDQGWLSRGVAKRLEALSDGAGKLGLVFGVPPAGDVDRLGLSRTMREGGALTQLRRGLWMVPLGVFGVALLACRPRRGAAGWGPPTSNQLLALMFLVTFVVGYVSPRYMLPAYPLAGCAAAVLLVRLRGPRRQAMITGVAAVLVFNAASWADSVRLLGAGEAERTTILVAALDQRGLTRCYSAGALYHVVFASGERILLSPLQKDRIPAYNAEIEAAPDVCYVYRADQVDKRQHVAMMRFLDAQGVGYDQFEAGPYRVLHGFSPREVLNAAALEKIRRQESARIDLAPVFGQGEDPI